MNDYNVPSLEASIGRAITGDKGASAGEMIKELKDMLSFTKSASGIVNKAEEGTLKSVDLIEAIVETESVAPEKKDIQ